MAENPPLPGEELQAIFSNYFHVNVQSDLTRIAFAEKNPNSGNIYYNSAFVMTTENASVLADLINRLVLQIRENEAERKRSAQQAENAQQTEKGG